MMMGILLVCKLEGGHGVDGRLVVKVLLLWKGMMMKERMRRGLRGD